MRFFCLKTLAGVVAPLAVALTLGMGASAVSLVLSGAVFAQTDQSRPVSVAQANPGTQTQRPELADPLATDPLLGLELETLRSILRQMEEEVELLRNQVVSLEERVGRLEGQLGGE